MASETESLTTMQAAFHKAGLITEERAKIINRIKASEQQKKDKAEKAKQKKGNNVLEFRQRLSQEKK